MEKIAYRYASITLAIVVFDSTVGARCAMSYCASNTLCDSRSALPFPSATYLRESARVQIAAPNNTTSLTRNWPGDAASAGNPYPACHTPGVVMTKLSVVKNIPIPARLADNGELWPDWSSRY